MSETRNPYSPPVAPVADSSTPLRNAEGLVENGRLVPIGHCTSWIGEAFGLFFQRPWKWIGTTLLLGVGAVISSLIPFSTLLTSIFFPVLIGGVACALESQRRTRSFTLNDIFAGFGPNLGSLATVGCVTLLSTAVMFAVFYVMVGTDAALAIAFNTNRPEATPPNFWRALLVSLVLSLPITAATFLAAPLIMLHGATPLRAMQMSFFGCLKNIVPWILFGVLMFLIIIVSALPLLLGFFITLPVALMAFYPMYRDIFVDEARTVIAAS